MSWDGGADCAYIDRVPSLEFVFGACNRIPAPVLPVYLGPPPAPALSEWSEAGAAVVIYPGFANPHRRAGSLGRAQRPSGARAGGPGGVGEARLGGSLGRCLPSSSDSFRSRPRLFLPISDPVAIDVPCLEPVRNERGSGSFVHEDE